jgi:DNA helicase-2/ATP-dependent DNA helicase PcrA
MKLNKSQEEAVNHFGSPLLVLAGAGSGKTRVITTKIAQILQNQLAMPSQILAVTFTNKAANEMLERVQHLVKIEGKYLNIGTFHRMALKILRRYADLLGYTKNFTILDTSDQKKVITDTLKRLEINDAVNAQTISGFISKVKEKFIKPQELDSVLHNFPDVYTRVEIVKIYEEYQKELKRLDAMDFDDLLFNCVDLLLKNDEIKNSYQNLFKYILIDEYQDINGLQQKWIKLIAGKNQNITCVGDDDQSIYGWRGSDISYILGFNKENSNAKVIKLEQNYRSTKDILNIASKLIHNNAGRHGKTLWTDEQETHKVNADIHYDSKSEAKYITGKIQEFRHRYEYKDFAILVRTIRQTRAIEEAMVFAGIPYKIIGGLRFYERKEVKDIIAYIKILVSSEDDLATERVITTPKRGLGDTTISKLYEQARAKNTNLLTILTTLASGFSGDIEIPKRAYSGLMLLGGKILKWRESLQSNTLVNIIKNVLKEIEYEDYLKKDDETSFEQRIENINELLVTLESFETAEEFLDYVSLATSIDDMENEADSVSIMTIHASKGLEFPFIFLPGWNQGLFPSDRTIEESGTAGIEEERRLAYVAITRARERLYISSTKLSFIKQGFSLSSEKSMFLDEILELAEDSIEFTDNSSSFQNDYSSFRKQKSWDTDKFTQEKATIPQSGNTFFIGNLVSHAKFGIGTVTKVTGTLVTVKFTAADEKTIREDFLTKKYI